jgi:hypothetical protein
MVVDDYDGDRSRFDDDTQLFGIVALEPRPVKIRGLRAAFRTGYAFARGRRAS